MNILEIILIGFSLSMDAFTVSITRSLKEEKSNNKLIMSISFGLFQMIMPIIGFLIGKSFYKEIIKWGNWISCIILVTIGFLMIKDSKKENEIEPFSFKILWILSLATSIDALSVGVTFTFVKYSIMITSSIIGIITFMNSYIGCMIGKKIESKIHNKSQILGGILLQLIGIKIILW